jgi:pimeloyl-ACP methyl ester carboxylesterase
MESRSLDVGGVRMRWEEEGEGHSVVFIHGIPTSPRLWRHVIPGMQGACSMAWEMVGYGASIEEGWNRNTSVAKQADYLASWMREVGLESALLVGHDLGGGVAQILAVRQPELVRGIVLINSICYDSWPIPSVKVMVAMGPAVERLPNSVVHQVYSTFLYRGHNNRERAMESIEEHWPYYERAGGAVAMIQQIRSLNVNDTLAIADQIPNLDVPARLVWGAEDQFQKIGYGYRLAYELGASIERIEDGKHFVPEDHPEQVATAVNELLEQTVPNR